MTNDESEADRKAREAQEADIDERLEYGMNPREARGRDSCLVLAVAMAGGGAAVLVAVAKGIGSILRTR